MEAIKNPTFVCDGHQTQITVSMGDCLFPDQANDKEELIKVADQALYHAKKAGKVRVVFEGAPANRELKQRTISSYCKKESRIHSK
jgi:diguanylate cyclase (GGDEF)-like protein